MTLLEEIEADAAAADVPHAPRWRPWFCLAALILCASLILAHFGCHGDEDTELFSRLDWGSRILLEN